MLARETVGLFNLLLYDTPIWVTGLDADGILKYAGFNLPGNGSRFLAGSETRTLDRINPSRAA